MSPAKLHWADGTVTRFAAMDPAATIFTARGPDGQQHSFIVTDRIDADGDDVYDEGTPLVLRAMEPFRKWQVGVMTANGARRVVVDGAAPSEPLIMALEDIAAGAMGMFRPKPTTRDTPSAP